jgi:hypothetical protein
VIGQRWPIGGASYQTGKREESRKSHLAGVSTHKEGRTFPYYLCSKRWNIKDCDLDYVRAELLEAAIMQDIKTMFRDERFMARIWAEAN